jgi:exportin-1
MASLEEIITLSNQLYASGINPSVASAANDRLTQIKDDPESYRISADLINCDSKYAKMFGCILLKNAVTKNWHSIPEEEREGIKTFIAETLIQWAESGLFPDIQTYISSALAAVIVREWPQQWPNIVEEIISSAQRSDGLMQCNLTLLSHISEDIKDFSEGYITSNRLSQLNRALKEISPSIMELIEQILSNGPECPAAPAALSCLGNIIKWMDPRIFFQADIFANLASNFIPVGNPELQEKILIIFADFANNESVPTDDESLSIVANIFEAVIESVSQTIPEDTDYQQLYMDESKRVNAILYMLNAFITHFLTAIETYDKLDALNQALIWSISLMEAVSESTDCFRNLCDIWNTISRHYYFEATNRTERLNELYQAFMPTVRRILANYMFRPPEVIYTKEENGVSKIMRANDKEAQTYKSMHEALNVLTNIDPNDTIETINEMVEALKSHAQDPEFDAAVYNVINKISWSTGAISGAIPKVQEKPFILNILIQLLTLFEAREDVEDKAVIGSGVMFICSQYPRFLTGHYSILKVITGKLIEFMTDSYKGVKQMAVSTFKNIAEQCKKSFIQSPNQDATIYQEIVGMIPTVAPELEEEDPMLCVQFYDALSTIAAAFPSEPARIQAVEALMEHPNSQWEYYSSNFNVEDENSVNATTYNLRYVAIIADNTGQAFHQQFQNRIETMIALYNACWTAGNEVCNGESGNTLANAITEALAAVVSVIGRFCKHVRGNILNFIKTTVTPALNDSIITQYAEGNPLARVPEVITMLCNLTESLGTSMTQFLPDFLVKVYLPTVNMINEDQESFVPFRLPLINLADLWIKNCNQAIYQMDGDSIEMFYGSIMWACISPIFDISKAGLETMKRLFTTVQSNATAAFKNAFYSTFYIRAVRDAFNVLTDSVHKFAFAQEVDLIKTLFNTNTDECEPTIIGSNLCDIIENRDAPFLVAYIGSLFEIKTDMERLRESLKDFLIELKDYTPDDKELDLAAAEEKLRILNEQNANLPGIVNAPAPTDEDYNFNE